MNRRRVGRTESRIDRHSTQKRGRSRIRKVDDIHAAGNIGQHGKAVALAHADDLGAIRAEPRVVGGDKLESGSGPIRERDSRESLEEEGRDDLVRFADDQVNTGEEAEAYAGYIAGHVEAIGEGATFAELGDVERAAEGELTAALESGAPTAEVTALEETAAGISGQRDAIFRGEMLRGALLSTFAWSTVGAMNFPRNWHVADHGVGHRIGDGVCSRHVEQGVDGDGSSRHAAAR